MITQDQIKERLESPNNLANRFSKVPDIPVPVKRPVGMPPGQKILPTFIKNTIAIMDKTGTRQKVIGADFGVTQAAVSNIATGRTNYDHDKVGRQLEVVRDLAMERLLSSLGLLTDDKIAKSNAVDISRIAQSLSNTIRVTLPREEKQVATGTIQLTVYAPQLASEKDYKIIEV